MDWPCPVLSSHDGIVVFSLLFLLRFVNVYLLFVDRNRRVTYSANYKFKILDLSALMLAAVTQLMSKGLLRIMKLSVI